jgi:hypothetical protein
MYLTPEDYEIAERNGIPRGYATSRFYTKNWSRERAITEPVKKHNGPWKAWKETCKQTGISRSSFNRRVQKGMTPEEAATTPPTPPNKKAKRTLLTDEQVEIAKQNGIGYSTLVVRISQYKWPIEKAIHTPVDTRKRRKNRETVSVGHIG